MNIILLSGGSGKRLWLPRYSLSCLPWAIRAAARVILRVTKVSPPGGQHSVREFVQLAFHHAGIELEWSGSGLEEKGINKATGK